MQNIAVMLHIIVMWFLQATKMALELMFHPGNLAARAELLDERSEELAAFYLSGSRFEEAECLKRIVP